MGRPLSQDVTGVASTVGTIFVLLIVLSFLAAIFAAQRLQQKDREWSLIQQARSDFGLLRQAHDWQFIGLTTPSSRPSTGLPGPATVTLQTGLPGEGPFLPPIPGVLTCDPRPPVAHVQYTYRVGGSAVDGDDRAAGSLFLDLPTGETPAARLVWQNGGVLHVQVDGAVMVDYPYFRVEQLQDGLGVTVRLFRFLGDPWSIVSPGTTVVALQTTAADIQSINISQEGGIADLDDVRAFVRDVKQEITEVSTDGSGWLTGSYADVPPSEGILNQGLTEQLVYYDNAEAKQQIPDCEGASNDINASARQLLLNVMNKILEGIATGYIDPAYGMDLYARLETLLHCLDEMAESLLATCEFECTSLLGFGTGGGSVEITYESSYPETWRRWFDGYLRGLSLDPDTWNLTLIGGQLIVHIGDVRQLRVETAHVTIRPNG